MSAHRFNLAVGEKFGALVLSGVLLQPPMPHEVHLGNDEWLLTVPPLQLQEHWQRWLGEIRARALAESNLWLVTKRLSSAPAERNQETRDLMYRAHVLAGALALVTPLAYQSGFGLTGANLAGEGEVHEFADQRKYRRSHGEQHVSFGAPQIPLLIDTIAGLDQILASGPFERVRRGLFTLLRALQRDAADARLHQFVRALEGVIKPEIGRSRRQFVHRGQTFAGAGPPQEGILGECFDVRSQVEHLHDWEAAFAHIPQNQRADRLLLHVRRMETLCRGVYTRVCTSLPHRALFRDDAIDAFWQRPSGQRAALWGNTVDLLAVK